MAGGSRQGGKWGGHGRGESHGRGEVGVREKADSCHTNRPVAYKLFEVSSDNLKASITVSSSLKNHITG